MLQVLLTGGRARTARGKDLPQQPRFESGPGPFVACLPLPLSPCLPVYLQLSLSNKKSMTTLNIESMTIKTLRLFPVCLRRSSAVHSGASAQPLTPCPFGWRASRPSLVLSGLCGSTRTSSGARSSTSSLPSSSCESGPSRWFTLQTHQLPHCSHYHVS